MLCFWFNNKIKDYIITYFLYSRFKYGGTQEVERKDTEINRKLLVGNREAKIIKCTTLNINWDFAKI